ncbi:MAG: FAD-dependent oxidoreductase [Gammaproteobacteria bacterium]|nr:FAD-dependent oxidoreductase [Gammaproteobacteria bacterium]MDH3857326.1 FAD-dependent oxidoreductase [Gammaproteobacteria bacterium]
MQRYSLFSLARNAFSEHRDWSRIWRSPPLKQRYDVIIIGAGGHGLATAYYLAKNHGITNVAVIERGWLGGGNIARNTVTIRSNYMRDESIPFFVKSVALYEGLTSELNYNLMYSNRSMIDVVQTYPKLREIKRRMFNGDLYGSTYDRISVDELRRRIPPLTGGGPDSRLPIIAGMVHSQAAVCRHDAVAWSYARAADDRGVEIHQNTEVTRLLRDGPNGEISGVETNQGKIYADKVAVVVSGHTTSITDTIGLKLPLKSFNLTAFVSEPVKPLIDVVVNCPDIGVYLSQSDKGELVIGGAPDPGQSFCRDIKQNVFEDAVVSMLELFPSFKRLKLMRQWGGTLDIAHDASPIVSKTDVPGLFVSAGWWGGFKAVPAGGYTLAHLIATNQPHALIAPFSLARFRRLDFILEAGTTTAT